MRNARLKRSLIEYWFIIYTNVLVVPYYIVPWFLYRKLVSKFRPPLKQLGIKLRKDCEILYIIIAMKQERAAITF